MLDGPAASETATATSPAVAGTGRRRAARLLMLLGPGVMVMLADTDAGSVITAAQSGAQYGYQLVLSQLILIPILYLVQEMTVRLGLVTGRGHGALIRQIFGSRWALLSAGTLFVACVGALITEFAGLAGVGALVGLPRLVSIGVPAVALVGLVLAGRYRRVEVVGITVGALELLFIPAAIIARPDPGALLHGLANPIQFSTPYLTLLAANVGAVIMPWMVFYQQGAVIDKGRRGLSVRQALRSSRLDTAVGSVVTQVIMIAVVVAVAATIGTRDPGAQLNDIASIADALTPFLGRTNAVLFFGLGMIGAAVIAALVVALAGAWGMSEVLGWRHSLDDSPARATGFYALAVLGTVSGAGLVLFWPNLVALSVDVEVMNSCLLPVVLGFLLLLERRALPAEMRMTGPWRVATYVLTGLVIGLGLFTVVQTVANA
ncbi:NRAMP family divalent metal transporter [Pseudonocardia acidicola]|uniref:Divalent metal cation transporter n=1 Tax=Pseudonocardia acidicola TaxID=2724939 RepID=A0ABX1SHI3_9PSEU|nr:divalent metal cation transporter [Pseudonocardia acidicola]NMI01034.1 divalent metal cation transporter [Pseudonocardia acidicola]